MDAKIGVILGQVGTPSEKTRAGVRRYLRAFLSDDRVIDLPGWKWKPILHGVVLPFRPKKVLPAYEEIWTDEGSPLLVLSEAQRGGIQERLGGRFQVEVGMAVGEPSIAGAIARLEEAGIRKIVVLPMFPQYSNSGTAAIYDTVFFHALGRPTRKGLPIKKYSPTLRFIHPYFDDPAYIDVLAGNIERQLKDGPTPDRVIISFHGLPKRYTTEGDPYEEHCATTTKLLAERLGWAEDYYEQAYQSRFGREEWIKPYLQPRLGELRRDGIERPAIVSPGFTTDCLETLHELGIEGRVLFEDGGGNGEHYRTIACLNDDDAWLDYAANLIERNAGGW